MNAEAQIPPVLDAASFAEALAQRAAECEAALDQAMPRVTGPEDRVVEAMRYAALGGGKRLRAFLVLESAALTGDETGAADVAAAVEAAHAYSLAHDDLPCMDDDDLRRGRPTTHLAFDEATAVLAGDALQTLAFGLLADLDAPAERRVALISSLAEAIGARGMVGGQMIDLLAEGRAGMRAEPEARGGAATIDLRARDGVERLQSLKTGALIRFAATAGPLLSGADPKPLATYADALGLAFQIRDDLLDVEGDEAAAGKRLRKDAEAGKATFVDLLGVEGARSEAARLVDAAKAALSVAAAGRGETATDVAVARLSGAAEFALRRST